MRKALLFFAGGLLVTSNIFGQAITLSQAGYTSSPIGTDSLKVTTVASTFPSFIAATNATWDLSTVTDSAANLFAYRVAATTPATFADSNNYTFGTYAYKGNVQSAIQSIGILEYGIDIYGATYVLPTATTDSIYILTQNTVYSSTHTKIALPATCPSSWISSYKFDINFKLTIAIASYSLTPGYIRSYVTEKDTVIGWGKMRIKTLAGTQSGYMNALQIRTMTTTLDSFFVNGLPATTTLLSALGVTQGQVTKTYEQNFYRANEITPLANVQFSDSANTAPTKATTHVQRLPPNGIGNIFNDAKVKIYPNPISGSNVSIDVPVASGEWKYELVNISGQTVAADRLQLGNNQTHAQIQLSATLTPGIYYIHLINDGKQVSVKPLEIK